MMLQLKEKDKIYLFIKNIKTQKKYKNLNYIKVRSFFIKARKRTVRVEIKLFKNAKVDFVFYILLLELIKPKMHI